MSQSKVHIMVDIETLDVVPSAVILSIGAVTMPQDGSSVWFYYNECDEHQQEGRTISQSTIDWWKKQPQDLYPTGTSKLIDVLADFRQFILSLRDEPILWCKGTDFDIAILTNAFNQYHIPTPWKYNAIRDMRTLKKVSCHAFLDKNFKPHNALSDAKHQAAELQAIFQQNPNLVMA